MTSMFRIAAIAAAAVSLTACASMITGGPLVREGVPTGEITVHNSRGGGGDLDAVLISDCGASTYGLNRLPKDTAIGDGGYYTWTVSQGCWDVMSGAFDGYEDIDRIHVTAGQTTHVHADRD
jgi:hypothetical protein